jgi:hypothetical protein
MYNKTGAQLGHFYANCEKINRGNLLKKWKKWGDAEEGNASKIQHHSRRNWWMYPQEVKCTRFYPTLKRRGWTENETSLAGRLFQRNYFCIINIFLFPLSCFDFVKIFQI